VLTYAHPASPHRVSICPRAGRLGGPTGPYPERPRVDPGLPGVCTGVLSQNAFQKVAGGLSGAFFCGLSEWRPPARVAESTGWPAGQSVERLTGEPVELSGGEPVGLLSGLLARRFSGESAEPSGELHNLLLAVQFAKFLSG